MNDLIELVEQIEISTNGYADYIFRVITIEIFETFFVIILVLYFVNLVFAFVKNI